MTTPAAQGAACGACIRGIACDPANRGIGTSANDPERMRRVAARLEAAMAALTDRRAAAPAQEELPLSVAPQERETAS